MTQKDLLILAAVGVGAFYMLTSKARAAAPPRQAGSGAAQTAAPGYTNTLIAGGLGILSQLIGKTSTAKSSQQEIADYAFGGYVPQGLDFAAVNVPMESITFEGASQGIDWQAQSNGFTSQW